jgi:hypothetical protein
MCESESTRRQPMGGMTRCEPGASTLMVNGNLVRMKMLNPA